MGLKLTGDTVIASRYIGWAKQRLDQLKRAMTDFGVKADSRHYNLEEAVVQVSSAFGLDNIAIIGLGGKIILIICHVGDDTGINGYNKKFYRLSGAKLVSLTPTITGSKYSLEGARLTDDGKYFITWDGITHDDPDSYAYSFNPTGLVAECASGTAISTIISGRRFALNQTFEEEFFRAYVTTVDGTPRSYLLLDDSLTFRPYKIKGNPVFNRYTDTSIIYMHERVKDIGSGVLRIDMYGTGGISDGFGDNLFVVNNVYKKVIADNTKTATAINSDANGTAIYGTTKYYTDKRDSQAVGRVKTLLFGGFNFAEPAVTEEYGTGNTTETFNRCADGGNTCYYMGANQVSGTTKDPYSNILTVGFSTIANDIKLPYAMTDDGKHTYVRVQKDANFTQVKTGLYVADTLVEETGWEDTITLCDGAGGTQDTATGKWVMEKNGPVVIRKTVYTILHAHHDKYFKAALYKKTIYTGYSQDLLPYLKERVLGSQGALINGQIKRTLVEADSTYYVVVNGAISPLLDTNSVPYKYHSREYTLTSQSTHDSDVTHPHIYTWEDIPWVDIGYDKAGNLLTETNKQITRIFTTAIASTILFGFDVWGAKSKHNLVYSSTNPIYKYLWADYDLGVSEFPPLTDLMAINNRRWLLFQTSGKMSEIDTPAHLVANIDTKYNRVNGLLMLEI